MKSRKPTIPPYEKAGEKWKEYTSPYQACIHLAMNLEDRERWMRSRDLSDLRVFACGCYVRAWGHYWKRRGLDEGVYIYCVAGKGYYREGKTTWTIKPGELVYCAPRTEHEYWADATDPWTIYWLHVSGRRVRVFEKHLGTRKGKPVVHIGINPDMINQFKRMFTFFEAVNDDTHKLALQSCAAGILGTMVATAHANKAALRYSVELDSVLRFMEESLSKTCDVSDFAARAGLSRFHFCRVFKKATGMSVIHYFNKMKIQKACSLLAGSGLKIREIALKLGFEDPYYFSRCFKRIMGFAPTANCR